MSKTVESQSFATVLTSQETLLARLLSIVAIVQCWVYSDFLADGGRDVVSDFSDGSAKFMSKGYWELGTGVWVCRSFGREKDWTRQVFVEVGAADATVGDFESDFVRAAFPVVYMSACKIKGNERLTYGIGMLSRRMSPRPWNLIACIVDMLNM